MYNSRRRPADAGPVRRKRASIPGGAPRAISQQRENERRATRRAITLLLRDVPCADCGTRDQPWLMEFDHPPGTKDGSVSRMAYKATLKAVVAEADKCDVVCNRCHKLRTRLRAGHAVLAAAEAHLAEHRAELQAAIDAERAGKGPP